MQTRWNITFTVCIAVAVVVSRVMYAPKFLVNFDAVNFALAIREFNPGMDQPQPPGYPVFVMLLKLLDLLLHDARLDLLVAGLIGSVAAVLLLWALANAMYGEPAGYLSALVLAAQPLFWYAGIANPVRVYLAVISISTAWAGWTCLSKRPSAVPFLVMAVLLGLLSGFRPETLLLLVPLFVGVGLRSRVPVSQFVVAALLLLASAGSWISVLAYKAGGLRPFLELNFEYLRANSRDYTLAFGASQTAAIENIRRTFAWNFLPAISWAWALLFAWQRLPSAVSAGRGFFLTLWFLPAFLFHAFVHVRDLDQTLVTAPVVCLAGGWALAHVTQKRWQFVTPTVALVMLAVSVYSFRRPLVPDLKVASSGTVRFANDWMRSTFAAVDTLQNEGALAIVCYGSVVSWRQLSYYYPDTPVLYLPGAENGSHAVSPFWVLHFGTITAPDPISLPENRNLAWSVASGQKIRQALTDVQPIREVGPLVVMRISDGNRFHVGMWNFVAATDAPAASMKGGLK